MRVNLYLLLFVVITTTSCKVFYPNLMFRGLKETSQSELTNNAIDTLVKPAVYQEYVIRKGDRFLMDVYSNAGYEIISLFATAGNRTQQARKTEYLVKDDGYAKIPLLDTINILGMTITEAEDTLESLYEKYFIEPFVSIKVTNRRVFIYNGSEDAAVVTLDNENMTLLEVIALTGGLRTTTKAHKIKIIRGDYHNPEIIDIDLSTVAGMQSATLEVYANDMIYLEPTFQISGRILAQISPILAILTSTLLIIELTTRPTN